MKQLSLPLATVCLLISSTVDAQVTTPNNNATGATQYVGYNGTTLFPKSLDIKNNFAAQDINFFTNQSGVSGSSVNRMVIKGSGATAGFVGIGNNFLTPLNLVDVRDGNINIGQGTAGNVAASPQSYMIGGNNILWHNGDVTNLFVGVNAGLNTAGATAFQNTYIGNNAGAANTTGQRNTAVGANAGLSISTGKFNTFIGTEAGKSLTTGIHNTFVGEQAGDNQITGNENTILGAHTGSGSGTGIGNMNTMVGAFAGAAITNGNENTFTGRTAGGNCTIGSFNTFTGASSGSSCSSGLRNTMNGFGAGVITSTGNDNVFMGFQSGRFNSTGSSNTYIGTNAGTPSFGFGAVWNIATNATAIGNDAKIRKSDVMILGNNLVNVGIGLSNDISTAQGPQNKLEIDAGINGTSPSPSGASGASGLRFRDLHSGNTTTANGINGVISSKVLTVDQNGDVVLTDATNGLGNICGNAQNILQNDWEIPMNGKNYTFSDPATLNYGQNSVRIGATCSNPIFNAKLEVIRNVTNFPSTVHTLVGVASINSDNFPALVVGDKSISGYFVSDGGNSAVPTNYSNYGVVGIAKDARANYGGYFEAKGPGMGYGVYAKAISNPSGTGSGPLAGYFDGDVIVNGPYSSYNNQILSDKNIKNNVVTLNSSMEVINKLRPVSFKYNNSYAPQLNVDNNLSYGFIAQEVGNVLPTLTRTITVPETLDSTGNIINPSKNLTTLNYDAIIPFAIGGIQELNSKQKEMQANIDKLNLSDAQVKTNINTFNALATVKTLSPVKYNFTNANVPQLSFKPNIDYGFIAQQLETVYPELVDTIRVDATYDSLGVVVNPSKVLKTVNYKAMSALLVRSIQEQQLTIDSLRNAHSKQDSINNVIQQQLAALATQINSCCSNTNSSRQSNTNINQLDVELSDKDAIVLNQNVPNPFAEQTTITYNVPTSVSKAQIIFYNSAGQIIQTVDVKTRGKGKVNVFANDLSSGLYHYTLVADGKVVDSKKMVRE